MIKTLSKSLRLFGTVFLLAMAMVVPANVAYACCSCVGIAGGASTQQTFQFTIPTINDFTTDEFVALRRFYIGAFWEDNILPALMLMAEQFTTVAMQQVQIVGSFFDAEMQMEAQRSIQKAQARANKEFHPSAGMCEFGSSTKSLAASERLAEFTAIALSQRSLDRQTGNANTVGVAGELSDKSARMNHFKTTYCNPQDFNNGLGALCGEGAEEKERTNKDVNFVHTVYSPWTLDVDFTDGEVGPDEEDLFALSANLYAHSLFQRPSAPSFKGQAKDKITPMQRHYLNARALIAKRSVAEGSFNAIAAQKAMGTEASAEFMRAIIEDFAAEDEDLTKLVGEKPSYYAQMEVLTKTMYQNPDFFTNLYDKPANVERKKVAMQAIGLMQKFDMYKSHLRNEALMAVLLEMAILEVQDGIERKFGSSASRAGGG